MSSIQNIVIVVLVVILIVITTTFGIMISVKNNIIDKLTADKAALTEQVGAANMSIKFQNERIEKMAVDIQKNTDIYNNTIKNIHDNYTKKLNDNATYKTCEEMLDVIIKNQKEFMYAK